VRQQAQQEKEQAQQVGAGGAPAAEVRARAEHLKKQRDLILAKRKKERESDASATAVPVAPTSSGASNQPAPASVMGHRAAGFSSNADPNTQARAALSQNLASAMKSSLLGEDAATLDLQSRVDNHQRKMDLELTKQHLKQEAEEFSKNF